MNPPKEEDLTSLDKILPPRLEDAGLENCALPQHSIHEAFLKAASAVGCITEVSSPLDFIVGNNEPNSGPSGPSAAVNGGDVVVVAEEREEMKMNEKDKATSK